MSIKFLLSNNYVNISKSFCLLRTHQLKRSINIYEFGHTVVKPGVNRHRKADLRCSCNLTHIATQSRKVIYNFTLLLFIFSFESNESMIITCSTKVCSFGKQVVEKVETEYSRLENGRFVYRIHRSPMCDYMINFINKLKRLPEKYMMNSVLENFTILQVSFKRFRTKSI